MVVAAQVADVVRPRAAQVERLCAGHQHARNEVHLFGRIEVDMSPFGVFEHGRAVTQAVGFEIVVGRKHRHVLPVARLAFEAVLAQASVDVFQRPGFHARPEHLQDFFRARGRHIRRHRRPSSSSPGRFRLSGSRHRRGRLSDGGCGCGPGSSVRPRGCPSARSRPAIPGRRRSPVRRRSSPLSGSSGCCAGSCNCPGRGSCRPPRRRNCR